MKDMLEKQKYELLEMKTSKETLANKVFILNKALGESKEMLRMNLPNLRKNTRRK